MYYFIIIVFQWKRRCVFVGDWKSRRQELLACDCLEKPHSHLREEDWYRYFFSTHREVDGRRININVYNANDFQDLYSKDLRKERPYSYKNTDVFAICISIWKRFTFLNVENKWMPEMQPHIEHSVLVLVGIDSDTIDRKSILLSRIQKEEAEEVVRKYNMYGYVECRLSDDNNIRAPLDMIARACVENEDIFKSKSNNCCCACL